MLFNSYIFTLVFLPLCLAGYFGLNRLGRYTLAQFFLFGMSLWFYGYFHPSYLVIMVGSIVGNYLFTLLLAKLRRPMARKAAMVTAVLLNLGVLFYFKYFDFFLANVNRLIGTSFSGLNVMLPLGISFFTFQQVGYIVDAYRGELRRYPFVQYACFVSYFPQLIAGPIVTHDELIPQFLDESKKHFQWENFAQGLYMFALGAAKKVLLADTFGKVSAWGFGDVLGLDTTNAILVALAYTIQIYFDFSGYCDMATGMARMMNIDLPMNFNSPYKALTIGEFWDRWHMTLTRFLTKYIYFPLGGSRKGAVRTYCNILIVFLASGLWHGAAYTYILWGLVHGILSIIGRRWKGWFQSLHPALSWGLTFSMIVLTMSLFRSNTVTDFLNLCKAVVHMQFGPISDQITGAFLLPELGFLMKTIPAFLYLDYYPGALVLLAYGFAMGLILGPKNSREHMLAFRPTPARMVGTALLLAWCILSFSGVSTFLYFNF